MIRALRGSARVAAARWTRGPLLPSAMLVMLLAMVAAPPTLFGEQVVAAWRDDASYALGMVGWVVLLSAVVLPVVGGAPNARRAEGRIIGARIATLGHAAALWLVLAIIAAAGAGEASAWLRLRHPSAEGGGVAPVSAPLWSNEGSVRASASDPLLIDVALPKSGLAGGRLRLSGSFRLTASESGPAGVTGARLVVTVDGRSRPERMVRPDGTGRLSEVVDVPPSARNVTLALRSASPSIAFHAVPGAVRVAGDPVPTFGVLLRAGWVFAATGVAIAMFVLLLSGWMHPALALIAGITAAIAAAAFGHGGADVPDAVVAVARWLPGWVDVDPARALRLGIATTWTPVVDAALRAALWTAIAVMGAAPADAKEAT